MSYNNKKVTLSVIYQSPSQSTDDFDSFLSDFEKFLNGISNCKPSSSVITSNFNSRSSS